MDNDNLVRAPFISKDVFKVAMFRLMPKPIVAIFVPGDHWYLTLLASAKAQGIKTKTKELSFVVRLPYNFVGFRKIEECWTFVYQIKDLITCTLIDKGVETPVTTVPTADLIYIALPVLVNPA